jgi:hypothetical protein
VESILQSLGLHRCIYLTCPRHHELLNATESNIPLNHELLSWMLLNQTSLLYPMMVIVYEEHMKIQFCNFISRAIWEHLSTAKLLYGTRWGMPWRHEWIVSGEDRSKFWWLKKNGHVLLPMFQFVGCFGKSRFIDFAMHLDIHCVYILSKIYVSWFAKTTYNLERRE